MHLKTLPKCIYCGFINNFWTLIPDNILYQKGHCLQIYATLNLLILKKIDVQEYISGNHSTYISWNHSTYIS